MAAPVSVRAFRDRADARYAFRESRLPFRPEGTPLTEDQLLNRKRVYHQITTEPRTFDMSVWDSDLEDAQQDEYDEADRFLYDEADRFLHGPSCGTTRCLAGWSLYFRGTSAMASWRAARYEGLDPDDRVEEEAVRTMGLTRDEYRGRGESTCLFYLPNREALNRMKKLAGE